jgi:hypothetical protein
LSQSVPIECPAPIPGRIGHVGGIESITLDGKRYFFGFDFSSDWVVSPLIEGVETMAVFASQYMEQRDGSHEPSYWRELAQESIEMSDLSSEEGSRDFLTSQLQQVAAQLKRAEADRTAIPEFDISYHLRYLLAAASEWPDPFADPDVSVALGRLGLDPAELSWSCVDASIAFLNGSDKLQPGASNKDAATVIQKYLRGMVCKAPANWRTLFSSLAPEN